MCCRLLSRNLRRVAVFILYTVTALSWCQVWWLIACCQPSWTDLRWGSNVVVVHSGGLGSFGALNRFPQPHPNTPGSLSTWTPRVSSSSGYGSSYSSSRPCQDDCMRPVSRLPVSDLPTLRVNFSREVRRPCSVSGFFLAISRSWYTLERRKRV